TSDDIWWGDINRPFSVEQFEELFQKMLAYFQGKNAYVQNAYAGADPNHRLPVRIITETAWHSLFARNMFIRVPEEELEGFKPGFTVLHAPNFHALPQRSEERRVGKECRSRGWPTQEKTRRKRTRQTYIAT